MSKSNGISQQILDDAELEAITPTNDELRRLARLCPPASEWLEGDEIGKGIIEGLQEFADSLEGEQKIENKEQKDD